MRLLGNANLVAYTSNWYRSGTRHSKPRPRPIAGCCHVENLTVINIVVKTGDQKQNIAGRGNKTFLWFLVHGGNAITVRTSVKRCFFSVCVCCWFHWRMKVHISPLYLLYRPAIAGEVLLSVACVCSFIIMFVTLFHLLFRETTGERLQQYWNHVVIFARWQHPAAWRGAGLLCPVPIRCSKSKSRDGKIAKSA